LMLLVFQVRPHVARPPMRGKILLGVHLVFSQIHN
jgi:hypothetical protein